MVEVKTFLPTEDQFTALEHLAGAVTVRRVSDMLGAISSLYLKTVHGPLLELWVKWRDVRFKFEVFLLVVKELTDALPDAAVQIAPIEGWQTIKCCFRFEWERPASPGEVPPNWEQITHRRGKRDQIPDTATAGGVSMVGIVFWDARRDAPVAAFVNNDDHPPGSLRVLQDRAEIETFMSECENVDLADAREWCAHLQKTDQNSSTTKT